MANGGVEIKMRFRIPWFFAIFFVIEHILIVALFLMENHPELKDSIIPLIIKLPFIISIFLVYVLIDMGIEFYQYIKNRKNKEDKKNGIPKKQEEEKS